MKLLLDTHIFLWLIDDDERLSAKFRGSSVIVMQIINLK
jgi:PIN domain nuclease of toxin-antitoxin system